MPRITDWSWFWGAIGLEGKLRQNQYSFAPIYRCFDSLFLLGSISWLTDNRKLSFGISPALLERVKLF